MTLAIFVPDDDTLLIFHSHLSLEQLLSAIRSGTWQTPPALQTWLDGPDGKGMQLRATCQGRLVVLTVAPRAGPPSLRAQPAGAPRKRLPPLSDRQRQVLNLMAQGLTDREIAFRLHIHRNTVQAHIRALKQRFGARTRLGSVLAASEQGLLSDPAPKED